MRGRRKRPLDWSPAERRAQSALHAAVKEIRNGGGEEARAKWRAAAQEWLRAGVEAAEAERKRGSRGERDDHSGPGFAGEKEAAPPLI